MRLMTMIQYLLKNGALLIIFFLFVSCNGKSATSTILNEQNIEYSEDTLSAELLGLYPNRVFKIDKTIDLKGKTLNIPSGVLLKFEGNGIIKNGCLKGEKTKIVCKGIAFDRVRIFGTWEVSEINTSWFKDLSYDNALKDVVALSDPTIKNKIVIGKGNYQVTARKNADVCIPIGSNTEVIMNGTVRITPNDYNSYNIFQIQGENVIIKGKGTIIGDKHTHTGNTGEWGMGINLKGAVNTTISGLTIKDCWGDCIYVGGNSRDVLIEKCHLDHGRRQGISVTKADGVIIKKCIITNVRGTNPQYAIDIEPNKRDSVDNVLIEDVTINDCMGGIKATRKETVNGEKTPWIGSVTIKNCKAACKDRVPVRIKRCQSVTIRNCNLYAQKRRKAIVITETVRADVSNNTVSVDAGFLNTVKTNVKKLVGDESGPIYVKTEKQSIVINNHIGLRN